MNKNNSLSLIADVTSLSIYRNRDLPLKKRIIVVLVFYAFYVVLHAAIIAAASIIGNICNNSSTYSFPNHYVALWGFCLGSIYALVSFLTLQTRNTICKKSAFCGMIVDFLVLLGVSSLCGLISVLEPNIKWDPVRRVTVAVGTSIPWIIYSVFKRGTSPLGFIRRIMGVGFGCVSGVVFSAWLVGNVDSGAAAGAFAGAILSIGDVSPQFWEFSDLWNPKKR